MRRWATLLATLATASTAHAQDLGHKILGGLGIDAGVQAPAGLYVADRLVYYHADEVRDRNGQPLPIRGLDLSAVGNAVGFAGTIKIPDLPYLSFAVAVPAAHISLSSDDPRASVDRSGFGDIFVQPIKLGWRLPHFDVVGSYSFYAPTGLFEVNRGVGRGQWTHELSFGGALFFDQTRRWRISALASYDMNRPKRGIDLQRGNSFQIQGGAGVTLFKLLDVGVAGYALWQVTDDRGSALPGVLRGARDRVFGVGPELGVIIPKIRMRAFARYEWDLGAESRPQGQVLSVGLSFMVWKP